MGDRYYLTGTQIGMIKAYLEVGLTRNDKHLFKKIDDLLDEIIENQFISHTPCGDYRCPKCGNILFLIDTKSLERGDKSTLVQCASCRFEQYV